MDGRPNSDEAATPTHPEEGSPRGSVLFGAELRPPVGPLSRRLAPHLGCSPSDLASRLRNGGGWVVREGSPARLEAVSAILVEASIAHHIVPAALPEFVDEEIRHFEPSEHGWRWYSGAGEACHLDGCIAASLTIRAVPGPSAEVLQEWRRTRRRRGDERARTIDTTRRLVEDEAPPLPFRKRLEELEYRDHWPSLVLVRRDPLTLQRLTPESVIREDALDLHVPFEERIWYTIDRVLKALPEERLLPATRQGWFDVDPELLLEHRIEAERAHREWLAALVGHGHWNPLADRPMRAEESEEEG